MNRRDLILSMAAAAAAARLPRVLAASDAQAWGLQLFTVMAPLELDFDGVLGQVADIGYREVETIGSFGRDAAAVRAMLDRHGLRSPSQHLMPAGLYREFLRFTRREITMEAILDAWRRDMAPEKLLDNVREAIVWAKALGQQFVVLQELEPRLLDDRPRLEAFCKTLNAAGALCADAGLQLNLHNHSDEFQLHSGYVPYELVLAGTDPALVKLELDIYWAVVGKADPLRLFSEHPGRFQQCHVKDADAKGGFATVGKGAIDFRRILPAARTAGVRHFYVEYDRADDPMQVVREAYGYLSGEPAFR